MADASESSFPFSNSNLATEEQWARFNRAVGHQEGVVNSTLNHSAPDLQVTPGAGSTVQIAAGEAAINGFYYSNSTPISRSIPSNAGSSTLRNDTVVLEVSQPNNEVTVKYLTGGASFPSLTRSINGVWQMPLAAVQVRGGQSSVTGSDITDRRQFVQHQGIVMGANDQSPIGKLGQFMYRPDGLWVYRSAGWAHVWPIDKASFTNIRDGVGYRSNLRDYVDGDGGGLSRGAYGLRADGTVELRGIVEVITQTAVPGKVICVLPTGMRPNAGRMYSAAAGVGSAAGDPTPLVVTSAGEIQIRQGLPVNGWVSLDGISFTAS